MINKLKSSQLTYTTYNITLISIIEHFLETKPNALKPEDCILNCWMNKKLCLYLKNIKPLTPITFFFKVALILTV